MKNFSGKTVVITGAGSGIGRGLASLLAKKGADLALVDLSIESLNETVNGLSDKASSVRCYPLDVSDKDAVYALADKVYNDFGRVDVVINNAGVALSETVEDMSYEDFEWVMNINFWGVVYGTKAFLPYLKRSSEAYVVNISSIFGLISLPTQSAYNASKFAVKGFTEALRLELKGSTVSPICVHPGGIKTNIAKSARFYKSIDGSLDRDEAMGMFNKFTWTTPDKAAETIVNGIVKNNCRVLIGPDARVVDWFQRLLPDTYDRILGVFLNKSL